MDIIDFKSLILNAIEKKPEVKSKIMKRILGQFYEGYRSSNFVQNSQIAQKAMNELISNKDVEFIKGEPLKILKEVK